MCKHKSSGMDKTTGESSQPECPQITVPLSSHIGSQNEETSAVNTSNRFGSAEARNGTYSSDCRPACDAYTFLPNPLCNSDQGFNSRESQDKYHFVSSIPRSQSNYEGKENYRLLSSVLSGQSNYPHDDYHLMSERQLGYPDRIGYTFPQNIQVNYQDQNNYHFMPNVQDSQPSYSPVGYSYVSNHPEHQQSFLDSDEETEQSPMLTEQQYKSSWNPNVISEGTFNILPSSPFAPTYSYSNSENQEEVSNCDNFAYQHYKIQNTFQKPVSYTPQFSHSENFPGDFEGSPIADLRRHSNSAKKKWLLNQKCKSADSEPNGYAPTMCRQGVSLISYNYVQGTNTLTTHPLNSSTYTKPLYSNNGDPIAGPSGLQRPCSINWEMGMNAEDVEFRSRSYSLTPTINFAVFETESSSDAEDMPGPIHPPGEEDVPSGSELQVKNIEDSFELPVVTMGKVLPVSPSAAQLSIASSYGDNGSPICKICHTTARENDPLISPCRCSGTMQYIHCMCLMKWLDVCHKRGKRPVNCELCQYQYHWHKKFEVRDLKFPPCSRKDKILHILFVFSVLLMVTCASLTVMFFKQDKGTRIDLDRTELTHAEIGNLVCGVLFFVAFFVAIYVEAKSHDTLYQLVMRFIHMNQQWYIDEYEKKETPPVAV